ncbi:MAG: hypothetical protein WC455_20665 [Dehalococcoidia bacterium]|jgi:hypothetical protein
MTGSCQICGETTCEIVIVHGRELCGLCADDVWNKMDAEALFGPLEATSQSG